MEKEEIQFIAVSNISELNLKEIISLGLNGIPSPSVQIKPFPSKFKDLENMKLDKNSLLDYGDISIIFNKSNLFGNHNTIPKNDSIHNIYAGDGYTLRFPDIKYKIIPEERKILIDALSEINKKFENAFYNNFDSLLQNDNKINIMHDALDSNLLKLKFLKENKMLDKFSLKYKYLEVDEKIPEKLKLILKDFSPIEAKKNPYSYKKEEIKKYIENSSFLVKKILTRNFTDDSGEISANLFAEHYSKEINSFKQKKEKKKVLDKIKVIENINKLIKKAEKECGQTFFDYAFNEISWIYHDPKIEDNNKPVTIENVSNYMKRNRGSGSEIEMSNFLSLNKNVAKTIPVIRNFNDLISNLDILTNEDRESNCYIEITRKLFNYHSKEHDENIYSDKLPALFSKYGKNGNLIDLKTDLETLGFKNVSDDVIREFNDFIKKEQNKKQYYYEAKPNKPFYFKHSNFKDQNIEGIVVPNDISPELLKHLEKNTDLKIVKYNPHKPESRMKALFQFRGNFISNKNEVKIQNTRKMKR